MNVEVIIYFNNGATLKRLVDKFKALDLFSRHTVLVPSNADILEIAGISDTYIVPSILIFTISKAFVPKPSRPTKRNIYDRDGGTCVYCGKRLDFRDSTLDHVLPGSRGGQDTWENLVTSCQKCNHKKDNRTPQEAGMRMVDIK